MSKTVVTTSGQRMFTFLIVGWNADPLVRMVTSREPITQPSVTSSNLSRSERRTATLAGYDQPAPASKPLGVLMPVNPPTWLDCRPGRTPGHDRATHPNLDIDA